MILSCIFLVGVNVLLGRFGTKSCCYCQRRIFITVFNRVHNNLLYFEKLLRVVQMGVHFTFEFNLGDKRRQADPTRKLGDVIFNRFSIDLDMSHHEVSITSQRIEVRNSWFELPSGLPLTVSVLFAYDKSVWL